MTRSVGGVLAATRDSLLAFFFPDVCAACGAGLPARRRHLCAACERGLRVRPGSMALPGRSSSSDGTQREGPEERAFYALEFEGATRALIHKLKYHGATSIAGVLAELVVDTARRACPVPPDVVTAVPLHPVRVRERGFNQSELIASRLADLMGVPAREVLTRVRHTPPQALLSRRKRLSMPTAAFRAPRDAPGCLGRVLLVDDVATTGATLAAASRALTAAGANEVVCFAVAGTAPGAPADVSRRKRLTGV